MSCPHRPTTLETSVPESLVHPGRDVGDVVTDMPEQPSQVRGHVARALVGIAAVVLNVPGLFTPDCHGD
jgi:hypothetical protein